ncbi:MAG: hypothetical protein IH996_06285 [Proteobacteria bacterium]|nr:hypothetical protein [Pseudomonadota bacterium]
MKIFQDKKRPLSTSASRRLRWLLVLGLIMASSGLAAAQEPDPEPPVAGIGPASGPPLSLQPGPYVSPETMSRLAREVGPRSRRRETARPGTGIESGILEAIDPAAIGILNPETGGLPANLWAGARRRVLESLFPRIPVATLSPTLNTLAGRVLLSAGPVPEAAEAETGSELLEARLEAIAGLGRLEPLIAYLSLLPEPHVNLRIRRIMADAYLLDGDLPGACEAAELGRSKAGTAYWLRLEALCMAVGGNQAGAAHNIDLLIEAGEVSVLFVELIEAVSRRRAQVAPQPPEGPQATLFKGPELDPVFVALSRAAERQINIEAPEHLPLLVQASLASDGNLQLDLRADLGELAASVGAIEGEVLGEIFLGQEFTEGQRKSVEILAQTNLGAGVDGLIYKMAAEATDDQRRLELVELGWERGLRMKTLPALGPVYANLVRNIRPRRQLIDWAPLAGRVLLYAAQEEAADGWSEMLLEQVVLGGTAPGQALAKLWPLQFATGSKLAAPFSVETLALWRQTISVLPQAEQLWRASLLYSLLEALGQPVPQEAWDEVLAAPAPAAKSTPGYALWRQLILSANAGRLGETVCLVLVGLGREGTEAASIAVLTTALAALRQVGLEKEARALARERLIAAGF